MTENPVAPVSALALDIGGTKLAVGIVDDTGAVDGYIVEPTLKNEGPDRTLERLFALGDRALTASSLTVPSAIGISCGGPLDAVAGILTGPLHLPGWVNIPIVAQAERRFGMPARLENDATLGALAEYRFGAGRGSSTMLYLTVSTGIGGGAVIDGRLHLGSAGNGGEFGHVIVRTGGRLCLCGRRGCLEAYASGTSIAERAREALEVFDGPTRLRGVRTIRAEDVVVAASQGDELAAEIWNETTDCLASAITDLVNVFEPDMVVLGGGVTRSGDQLVAPVRHAVLRDAMHPAAAAVNVTLAALGDTVCVVGAGAAAHDLLTLRDRSASLTSRGVLS